MEFILVPIDTKISMKQQELAIFLKGTQIGNFGQSAKGGPFAKISELDIFLSKLWKAIRSLILVAL